MPRQRPTDAQAARQEVRAAGKYAKFPDCHCGCGKPVNPRDYYSHSMTDTVDAEGGKWGDTALMLRPGCAAKAEAIRTVRAFRQRITEQERRRGVPETQLTMRHWPVADGGPAPITTEGKTA